MAGALLTILLVSGVWRLSVAHDRDSSGTRAPGDDGDSVGRPWRASAWNCSMPTADEAWALVRTVADDLAWDDAAEEGLGVRPGSAERALAALTRDERSELVRLLAAETKQPGA